MNSNFQERPETEQEGNILLCYMYSPIDCTYLKNIFPDSVSVKISSFLEDSLI